VHTSISEIATTPSEISDILVTDYVNGVINKDLTLAVINATILDSQKVRKYADLYFT